MKARACGTLAAVVAILAAACPGRQIAVQSSRSGEAEALVVAPDITVRLAKFVPAAIDVDDALITPEMRPVLAKLVQAAAVIDEIYLSQVSAENAALRARLAADPALADALAYFDVMYGPWDRLEDGEPFVGTRRRPPGVTFYPEDLTREELQAWIEDHPDQREAMTGYFSVVRRQGDGLVAIPYSEHYREPLGRAGRLLEEAAALTSDPRLERYLRLRAEAFRTDDYFASDVAWMQLGDGAIEVVIGPYEVYEDELMGRAASFEAFVTIRDPEASAQLERVSELAPELEAALPMEDRHRHGSRGETRPISVVYVITTAGDTRAGVQTLAFNLPNDERVRGEHGYKLVLLRNVMEAKYEMILLPIAQRLLHPDQLGDLSFAAFLNGTLMHESAHGLGPGTITLADGTQTDVNRQLRDLYSTIEEAKADIVGLYCSQVMLDRGELPRELERQMYATFLAGFFRSVRFGAGEAHGRANMIQFNYLAERGAIAADGDGLYRVDYDRIRDAVRDLAHDLLTIEGDGDYEAAQRFIERYGAVSDELRSALGRLGDVPVDIRPSYPAAARLGS
jgi:hypothetical protein